MYLTFDQVTLVSNRSRLRPSDPVVFERVLRGERVLTTDGGPSTHAGAARRYGRIYYDARDQPCVVPDRDEDFQADMAIARAWA